MQPRRRRRNRGAGNGATEADGPSFSPEGYGGVAAGAEGRAAGRMPGLDLDADVALMEAAAAGTSTAAPFFEDVVGGVSEAGGRADGCKPGLEPRDNVVETAVDTNKVAPFVGEAGTSTAAPFFGDVGGGVSEARADGCKPGLEPRDDGVETAVDTSKVAPFVGDTDEGADGSFVARKETGGGVMAPAQDASAKKIEHFSGSYAVGGSAGGNATELAHDYHASMPSNQGSRGNSLACGEESKGKLSVITKSILSWQLKDIMNDDLYRDKVIPVPNDLESIQVEEYMNLFSNHLIEECRATLKASIQRIQSSPSAYSVIDVLNTDSDSIYFMDINLSHVLDSNHKFHMARDGDIILFSTLPHQDISFENSFTSLGMVVGTTQHSNFHQGFKVVMIQKPRDIKFGCFLTSCSDAINVWNTLQSYDKNQVCSGINYILKQNELANTHCNFCNNESGRADTAPNNLKLSKGQLGIAKSLCLSVQCMHSSVVKMLTGPPGSGKTQILVAILHMLYQLDFRVLVCVPRNNGTFHLWKTLEASGYPINEIVVLDSLKGVRLPKRFHQTCLHIKSHKFWTCLVMVKQWIEEMQMLLRLQMYCSSSCNHVPKDGRCSHTSLPIFTSNLYRKAFLPLSIDMRKCLVELSDKFSKLCLPNVNKISIEKILNLLAAFENLLFNEAPFEDHIQRAFGYLPPMSIAEKLIQATSGCSGHLIANQMNDVRLKLADLLQTFGKSLSVPKFGNIKEVEYHCVAHSKVLIGTPQSIVHLHDLKITSINVLVVDDASRLKEIDLIGPLCLPLKHVLLFDDFCSSPPMVQSKVCYEAGFHTSLFQRLLKSKNIPRIKLDKQFAIEPNLFKFVDNRFYSGKIKSGSNVSCAAPNQHFANLEFTNYCFIDVTDKDTNSVCIELAGILYMLDILQNCWEGVDQNLHIAIMCLPGSPVDSVKDGLLSKYAGYKKIKLSIMYADSIDGERYDVVIISAFFKNGDQIDLNNVTAAITRARHCFWFLGDLSSCPGTLGELFDDARDRKYLMKLDPKKLQMTNDLSDFPASNNDSLMVGVESTWNGRPYRTKYVLGPMRNQNNYGTNDIRVHYILHWQPQSQYKFEYARQEPPEEFDWILCTSDLNKKYKALVRKEIGDEVIENRGSKRIETLHTILEEPGVLGRKRLQPEVTKNFKVKSCTKLEIKETEDMGSALTTLASGNVCVGNYRVSRNYFSLKPGEVYHYDRTMPYLNPRSSLPYAHAVMMIDSGTELTKVLNKEGGTELTKVSNKERKVHLNFQNSAGNLFGDNGFGKVGSSSVRSLHIITV